MRTIHRRRAVLLAVLALGAAGCEIVADIDRTKIDSGADLDAAPYDATFPDGSAARDVNVPETTEPDAADAGVTPDAPGTDTSIPDTGTPDAHDANVADTNVPDTNVPDTNVPDTNVPDTNVPADDGGLDMDAAD